MIHLKPLWTHRAKQKKKTSRFSKNHKRQDFKKPTQQKRQRQWLFLIHDVMFQLYFKPECVRFETDLPNVT